MKNILNLVLLLLVINIYGQTEKPNILFIFSDDQSFETLNANEQDKLITPNLDRLANEGTTFTHAYNQGSWAGAVCVASRSMLLTGSHLWNAKSDLKKWKKKETKVWPQLMSEQGYTTYMSGKWHVPIPVTEVFDITKNVRAGMPKTVTKAYNRPKKGEDPSIAWYPWDTKNGGFWEGGKHWSAVLGDDGVEFINEAAKDETPFFMYLAFNAPHDPRQSPKEYIDMYPLDQIEVPENYQDLYPDMGVNGVPKIRDEKLAPFPRTEYSIKVHRQEYYASITYMDAQIGCVLKALEDSGKADNTWIIFTSDHGLALGHHGLVGKQNMYEHSMRAPFIICGPEAKANVKIDTPIYLQDAMATSLELAGAQKPNYVEFKSVLPLMKDTNKKNYNAIYGAYMGTQRMVILGDWKLIAYPKLKKNKLFNLSEDPLEINNLGSNPMYANKLKELLLALEKMMDEQNDPMSSILAADYSVAKQKSH